MNKDSAAGFKTEFQPNPSPLSPGHLNPGPLSPGQLNPGQGQAQGLAGQSPFFFEKAVKSPPGHGQSQCDKCGWNFDNESFLQVRRRQNLVQLYGTMSSGTETLAKMPL